MAALLVPFIIIMFLILLNGMFVAAEFAIIGVRPSRVRQLAEEGHATAQRIYRILQKPARVDRYVASAQLGITLASLGLGMYGEPAIAHFIEEPLHDLFGLEGTLVHTVSFFIALGFISYLHVVIGEMIPKSLALQDAERVVFALATPMFLMQTLFAYPIRWLNDTGLLVLRLIGVPPPSSGSRLHTPDELELIITESVEAGLIEMDEQQLLRNIFDFTALYVEQVMVPRPKIDAVPVAISETELLAHFMESPYNRLPVYDGTLDNVTGILHLKDLIRQQLDGTPFDLNTLLHQVPFVPEHTPVDKLLNQLKQAHVHMAIVLDEYGGTAGLVTLEDMVEEVVGEVRDEFDPHEPERVTLVEDGHVLATGSARLDEVAAYVSLPQGADDPHVESVSGLVMAHLERLPPEVGDEVQLGDIRLRVEAINGLSVEQVSIHFPTGDQTSDDTPSS